MAGFGGGGLRGGRRISRRSGFGGYGFGLYYGGYYPYAYERLLRRRRLLSGPSLRDDALRLENSSVQSKSADDHGKHSAGSNRRAFDA